MENTTTMRWEQLTQEVQEQLIEIWLRILIRAAEEEQTDEYPQQNQ